MRKGNFVWGMLLLAALAGCAQFQWQKDGATQADFNRDAYQCQMDAAQAYPTALTAVQLRPGYQTPSQTYCSGTDSAYGAGNTVYGNTSMNCTTTPGQQVAPITTTYDANMGNRAQAAKACLYARGYQLVRVK